jgi:iron(III) transport system substrate-binding protein
MYDMKATRFTLIGILLLVMSFSCTDSSKKEVKNDAGEVNVYTHRHYEVDRALFRKFTEETGIKVNVVSASADELIKKLEIEGKNSPADVLITVDAGRLHRAKTMGLLQAVQSEVLDQQLAEEMRDAEGFWYAISIRARVIAYAKDRVADGELADYEDLANPKYQGRVLMRSSDNIYNQSLLASFIAHSGEEAAKQWVTAVKANLAREPKGNDRDQIKAIAAGLGDVTIVNTYYVGQMLNSSDEEEVKAAQSVQLLFPNQSNRGTHINVSGAAVTKYAPNASNAIKLIEFLTSAYAQEVLTNANYEYPVKEGVLAAEQLQQWGYFESDKLPFEQLGELNRAAVQLFDAVNWK